MDERESASKARDYSAIFLVMPTDGPDARWGRQARALRCRGPVL